MKQRLFALVLAVLILWAFCFALNNLEQGRQAAGRQQLEDAVRRAAVTCYAAEGAYPPNIRYLQDRYGLQYDEDHYRIHYELVASNLMPEITVLEK